MAQYLYALVRPLPDGIDALLGGLKGVTGPVTRVACGGEAVILGPHDGAEVMQTRRNMLAHTRVLEALMPVTSVMPMRFGVVAEDLGALDRLILARKAEIEAQFARLLDHVELGLRISFDRAAALKATMAAEPALAAEAARLAGSGAEGYFARIELGRRIAEALDQRRGRAQKRLLAALVPLAASHVLRAPESDVEVLRAEFLVPRDAQAAMAEAAATAAADCGFAPGAEPAIALIGPVPPYHFVSLSLGQAFGREAA